MQTVTVVVPTLNEGDAISAALAEVPWDVVHEVIVADGGSKDQTVQMAREAGARVLDVGPGYGRACQDGAVAAGDDCDIIVFMDGDGADPAWMIPELIAPIVDGNQDFVIGSRVRGKREPGSLALHQIAAGLAIGSAMRLIYGVMYTDMGAFRAISRKALMELGMREMTYGWNLEMQMRAARIGLRILEIPVPYKCRAGGRSKVAGSLKGSLKAGTRILTTFARVAFE